MLRGNNGNSEIVAVADCAKPVTMDSVDEDDEPLVFKRSRASATSPLENVDQLLNDSADFEDDDKASNEDDIGDEDNKSDEEDDYSEHVCEICDDGGTILCCQGKCLRSFHPTVNDGIESNCKSLGFTEAQVEEMNFYCENCKYKQHQCFVCGELGSSDESSGAEVFNCINGACGRFYHPICVAKLIHPGDEIKAEQHKEKIAAGEPFTCPLHRCHVCQELEDKSIHELQFAVCRRCPTAYHRKCLPRKIASERSWENLIPNRILIYCLKHKMDPRIETPVRNHIKFPGYADEKRRPLGSLGKKEVVFEETGAAKKSHTKSLKRLEDGMFGVKHGNIFKTRGVDLSRPVSFGEHKVHEMHISKSSPRKSNESLVKKLHIKDQGKLSRLAKPTEENRIDGKLKQTGIVKLDVQTKMRIMAMTKEASSAITLEEIFEKHKTPSTYSRSSKYVNHKVITSGKVAGCVKAVHTALKILEQCGSVEDAKAVCGADLLIQILKWKKMLKVHLAPFLHGVRYTSFGRHFTQKDKLKEIANMLHWYVQGGDTIVDFCCGSNDFSCLMKKKLDEMGKSCFYKNYDIVQAKNDFNFEKRDWMKVRPNELPEGSQLIMGLNPPFGVDASLANKFIDKALAFKPKLLILIVPRETLRLDKKKTPYDLVWENDHMLTGKAFYLPGSIDTNNKQLEDWNIRPPSLYLWSRPDWTAKHKAISQQHGHSSMAEEELWPEDSQCRTDGLHNSGGTEGDENDGPDKNHHFEIECKCGGKRKWERAPNETSPNSFVDWLGE